MLNIIEYKELEFREIEIKNKIKDSFFDNPIEELQYNNKLISEINNLFDLLNVINDIRQNFKRVVD